MSPLPTVRYWHIIAIAVVFAILGALAMSRFGPVAVPYPVVHRVTTVDTVYFGKPYPVRGAARLIYRTVPPDTVLISAPRTADTILVSFCDALAKDSTAADSAKHRALVLTAGRVSRSDIRLYGFTNTGQAYQGHFNVRAPYSWEAVGDSVEVQQPRIRWHLPSMGTVLACSAVGLGAGYLGSKVLP